MMNKMKAMTLETLTLVMQLPPTRANVKITDQLICACTSAGADYRAACRAAADADFIAKLKTVEEETDEAIYLLELLSEMNQELMTEEQATGMKQLHDAYQELLAVIGSFSKS